MEELQQFVVLIASALGIYLWLWRTGKILGVYQYVIKEKLYKKPLYIILAIVMLPLILLLLLVAFVLTAHFLGVDGFQ